MQETLQIFQDIDAKYNFNALVFYRNDITPWAQNFLKQIQGNENWVSVYKDDYAIIYLKNNDTNRDIIDKHKL